LSKRDLTLDLARVFAVLLVVVIHLLETGVGSGPGGLVVSRPLEHQPWFNGVTWVFQIMPLFFVVGGFASMTAWRSLQRRRGGPADYVKIRVLRLAQPAFPLFVFYVVVVGAATLVGIDGETIEIPAPIAGVLRRLVPLMAMGAAIDIVPVPHEVTAQQAADLLNISRPSLMRLPRRLRRLVTHNGDKPLS